MDGQAASYCKEPDGVRSTVVFYWGWGSIPSRFLYKPKMLRQGKLGKDPVKESGPQIEGQDSQGTGDLSYILCSITGFQVCVLVSMSLSGDTGSALPPGVLGSTHFDTVVTRQCT